MTIPALPPAPALGDSPEVFNTKAFEFVAALDDWGTEANATGVAVNANAVSADADAATATTQAGIATTGANTATTQAGIATTKAGEAATSANSASSSATAANLSAIAAAASAASIDPATLVKLTGDQTIAGIKTFTSKVIAEGLTVGKGAGSVATNTAVGASALAGNTTGATNTAVGNVALPSNTTGSGNGALGYFSLYSNTTGASNTALGYASLANNTTASSNTAVGYQAGYTNSTGFSNTYLGKGAGYSATGSNNTIVGLNAGYSVTGSGNTFVGTPSNGGAGWQITSGSKNTIIGGYDGNQGGLDIRTASNYIVLSDGDGNPRGVFDGSGSWLVGKTSDTFSVVGGRISAGGVMTLTADANELANFNRKTNDGALVYFSQDNTIEGSISVSGTTVSYNGGHLARYAQTVDSKDESLVKGTVLSNLNEMNVYTEAEGNPVDNEQLNKVKVSDVEGDANVAGVFVNWSYDEQHSVDEINMAMTGDMIIRIAQGTTVARGDLLMSAGDGTAKPQGDDIVRSKTVAKVTSTNVTCTYEDGSYCVPCVLMAC